jgi:hypothetical protein
MIRSAILTSMALTAMLGSTAFGQTADTAVALAAEKSEAHAESTDSKTLKTKLFEIKYCEPRSLFQVLGPLASGSGRATMNFNDDFKTITVRDYPENIAAIEEAINRLDKSEARSAGSAIEFYVYVLITSNGPLDGADVPAGMADIIGQLGQTLHYKNYALMSSSLQRGKEGAGGLDNSGIADPKVLGIAPGARYNPIFYNYALKRITANGTGPGEPIRVEQFDFRMRFPVFTQEGHVDYESVGFATPVTLRADQKSVVGTTTIGDKAVIVVVTASTSK